MANLSKTTEQDLQKRVREISDRLRELSFEGGVSKNTKERKALRKERARNLTELNGRTSTEAIA
jgi:hypothetical protein